MCFDWIEFGTLLCAVGALAVAGLALFSYRQSTIFAEQVRNFNDLLERTDRFGVETGRLSLEADRSIAPTERELTAAPFDAARLAYFDLRRALDVFAVLAPKALIGAESELRAMLESTWACARKGQFSQLDAKFHAYRNRVDQLREGFKVHLGRSRK